MTDETEQRQDEGAEQETSDRDKPRDQQESDSGGGNSPEGKAEQQQESDTEGAAGAEGGSEGRSEVQARAQQQQEEREQAAEKMREIEKDPPEKLEDWPEDKAKYETFGGPEGEHAYDEGPEAKLGPSSLRHHEDGKVTVEGEEVDDPDEYKGEPIPGGPTDPDAPKDSVAEKTKEKQQEHGADGEAAGEEGGD